MKKFLLTSLIISVLAVSSLVAKTTTFTITLNAYVHMYYIVEVCRSQQQNIITSYIKHVICLIFNRF